MMQSQCWKCGNCRDLIHYRSGLCGDCILKMAGSKLHMEMEKEVARLHNRLEVVERRYQESQKIGELKQLLRRCWVELKDAEYWYEVTEADSHLEDVKALLCLLQRELNIEPSEAKPRQD